MMAESRSMLFGEESEIRLALLARKQRKEAAAFVAGCEDWENVYSYEEKRLKSIVDGEGYHKWEKENRLWETENHLVPIVEDWEKEYSYEEKSLKSLVDEDGYYKWEKQNWLWAIDNYRVPEEQVSPEEEIRRKDLRFLLSLSRPLQDPKKAEEKFHKRLKELHTKVLTEEEKRLKDSYLEKMENFGPYLSKEPFFPFGPGWDLTYHTKWPVFRTLQPLPWGQTEKFPPTTLKSLLHKPTEGCTTPVISREEEREILAAQGRCLDGSYLTPYCKCNKNCYPFDTVLKEHPPECLPIWLAYCRQFRQSHCFDIDDYIGGTGCPLALSRVSKGRAEIMMKLANRAIQEYNEKECNVFKYKVLKIEKVNTSVGMYYTYWMTVKVLNLTVGTPIETFQIHAGTSYVNNDEVIYCCRPKEECSHLEVNQHRFLDNPSYLLFNFNDYPSGMVTLFNILVMGNCQLWMQSYKELTGTAWTYIYFVSFYFISVLWLLNLIVAFVLEAFQAEMDLEAAASCVDGDDKESRSEQRRNVGSKTRSQRVDFLLHHMLSSELTACSHDNP